MGGSRLWNGELGSMDRSGLGGCELECELEC